MSRAIVPQNLNRGLGKSTLISPSLSIPMPPGAANAPDVDPAPLTYPRPPALIAEYWKVVARERQKMFRAWAKWLDQRPNPEHVEQEIAATESVMRQMVRLRDETP